MLYKKLLILLILTPFYTVGQTSKQIDDGISQNIELANNNPTLAISSLKELKAIASSIGYTKGILNSSFGIMKILYKVKGDFTHAIEESEIAEQVAKNAKEYNFLINLYLFQSASYYELNLMYMGFQKAQTALEYIDYLPKDEKTYILQSHIYGAMSTYYSFKKDTKNRLIYINKSLDAVKKVKDSSKLKIDKIHLMGQQFHYLGDINREINQLDSAEFYYLASLKLYNDTVSQRLLFQKANLLTKLSQLYYQHKKYQKATQVAYEGLRNDIQPPDIKKDLYAVLYKSYLELNMLDSSKYFSHLYSKINDSITMTHQFDINSSFEKITEENKASYSKTIYKVIFTIVLILVLMVVIIWYWIRSSQKQIHQKYQLLITKLSQKNDIENGTVIDLKKEQVDPSKGSIYILDETLTTILKKLERFEKNNKFTKKNITLTTLANDIDTNIRYLSEIIKEHRGKNFNAYIQGLRIQFITQKLYEEPQFRKYKIAYLADISGFSSREVFATIFKKETGMTPSYFIDQLSKDEVDKN